MRGLAAYVVVACLACVVGVASGNGRTTPRWEMLPLPPEMPKASRTGFVDVGGASIYYAIYGEDPKREPVVLLHGGLGNSDHYGFQLPALVDKFEVIVIDSRGQGRSTLSKAKLTYHGMAEDVMAVLDRLGVTKTHVMGWSDGGSIALDLAINHPDRLRRVFVLGTNYDANGSKSRQKKTATFAAYATKCRADFTKLTNKPKAFDTMLAALIPVWRSPVSFTKKQISSIQVPTMVALGDHDEVIEMAQVKEMAKLIPRGQLRVFENASHFAMWQDPDSVNKAVVGFLTATN